MMLCFGIAKELGMTVARLLAETTVEEILGWSAYFEILNDAQKRAMEDSRQGR
jgi:hypothetical protein